MRIHRGGIWLAALCVGLLAAPAVAQADTAIQQTASASEVRSGETVEFTTTVTNTGPESLPEQNAGLLALRLDSERFVPNPYLSAFSAIGACNTDPAAQPYEYNGARCRLPALAPGQSTQIISTVEVNQSMEQMASAQTAFGASFEEVRAIYPPRVEGSKKIKVKGLPESCADRNLKLTISMRGAKEIEADLLGPRDEWGRELSSHDWRGGSEKDADRITFTAKLGNAPAGFYEIDIGAKPESKKGPVKYKKDVLIQRCGVPENY